jgi:hypothetical protein
MVAGVGSTLRSGCAFCLLASWALRVHGGWGHVHDHIVTPLGRGGKRAVGELPQGDSAAANEEDGGTVQGDAEGWACDAQCFTYGNCNQVFPPRWAVPHVPHTVGSTLPPAGLKRHCLRA